jgi:hypothetical protein
MKSAVHHREQRGKKFGYYRVPHTLFRVINMYVDWIQLAQNRFQCQGLVNVRPQVPQGGDGNLAEVTHDRFQRK